MKITCKILNQIDVCKIFGCFIIIIITIIIITTNTVIATTIIIIIIVIIIITIIIIIIIIINLIFITMNSVNNLSPNIICIEELLRWFSLTFSLFLILCNAKHFSYSICTECVKIQNSKVCTINELLKHDFVTSAEREAPLIREKSILGIILRVTCK